MDMKSFGLENENHGSNWITEDNGMCFLNIFLSHNVLWAYFLCRQKKLRGDLEV